MLLGWSILLCSLPFEFSFVIISDTCLTVIPASDIIYFLIQEFIDMAVSVVVDVPTILNASIFHHQCRLGHMVPDVLLFVLMKEMPMPCIIVESP